MYDRVVALDVGGATIKASRLGSSAPSSSDHPMILANHVATIAGQGKQLIGEELLDKERQRARLHYTRPIERGYCVNWNVETEIWSHLFSTKMLGVDPRTKTTALVTTAPLLAPTVLQETMDQVVFEEFGFAAYARVPAAEMCVLSYAEHTRQQEAARNSSNHQPQEAGPSPKRRRHAAGKNSASASATANSEASFDGMDWASSFHRSSCQLVVDSGFSFTHITPVIRGRVFLPGVKRINVGGKLMTNYLKEIVSYRQWNVMDENTVINELKESLCYCSMDFRADMERLHRDRVSRRHWVLPDFVRTFNGRLRDPTTSAGNDADDQALEMGVEMITVPEVLFHPSDIGLDQAGIAEAIMQSVRSCPNEVHSTLLENILLVGGNTKFAGFQKRLEADLRPLVPAEFDLRTYAPHDPILSAWEGCKLIASNGDLAERSVTKQEYEEYGSNICSKRF